MNLIDFEYPRLFPYYYKKKKFTSALTQYKAIE